MSKIISKKITVSEEIKPNQIIIPFKEILNFVESFKSLIWCEFKINRKTYLIFTNSFDLFWDNKRYKYIFKDMFSRRIDINNSDNSEFVKDQCTVILNKFIIEKTKDVGFFDLHILDSVLQIQTIVDYYNISKE